MPRDRCGRRLDGRMDGRGAAVLAVDIDTRFVEALASESIDVRRMDIRTDELPQSEFHLVHARLVLEHLTDRRQILERLAGALRPGGWIVIEDYDWSCFGFQDPSMDNVADAIMNFMEQAGFQRDYGRRVVSDLEAAGLTDVRGEGRARIIDSNSPGFDFFRLSFESLKSALVDAGRFTGEEADAMSARLRENMRVYTPIMMAGIGRRA
jgi:SAM-dependent methyltransferase